MKKVNYLQMFLLSILVLTTLHGFYGCGKKEVREIFPPVEFKPIQGALTGGAINDNLTVTVVEKATGKAIKDAAVFVHQGDPMELKATVKTDTNGVAAFAGQGIADAVSVTVTCNESIAYDTISFLNVNAAQITVPMERRKDPEKVKTALTFPGLDSGDDKLTLSRNDVPYKEKQVKAGVLETDPLVVSVPDEPVAFSAMATDAVGNTSKFGFAVEPNGPIPQATPAMINMVRVNEENVKICSGSIENPPGNLDEPTTGWDPYKRYIFQVFADGGMAGNVVTGFANLSKDYDYQAFVVNAVGLDKMRLEVSAMNRSDAWTEMSTAIRHFTFETLPAKHDFTFINAPKNLQIDKIDGQNMPDLIWESDAGNLTEIEIYHADYNYHWTLFIPGENLTRVKLPPLELGSPGAMVAEEIYRFRITKWLVPELDFNNTTFQAMKDGLTNRSQSTLVKFLVKSPEEE